MVILKLYCILTFKGNTFTASISLLFLFKAFHTAPNLPRALISINCRDRNFSSVDREQGTKFEGNSKFKADSEDCFNDGT